MIPPRNISTIWSDGQIAFLDHFEPCGIWKGNADRAHQRRSCRRPCKRTAWRQTKNGWSNCEKSRRTLSYGSVYAFRDHFFDRRIKIYAVSSIETGFLNLWFWNEFREELPFQKPWENELLGKSHFFPKTMVWGKWRKLSSWLESDKIEGLPMMIGKPLFLRCLIMLLFIQ